MGKVVDKDEFFRKIGYEPHSSGQWAFHHSTARFRVPVCGRRYGKSTMAGRDLEPELFVPKRRYWIVGPTYDLGEKEFRVIWDDLIVGQGLGRDKRVKKAYNRRSGDMHIEFPWGTRVEVRSAQYPETLVGEALHGVIMSEAAKHKVETWERFIRPTLADYRGWATFPTTPEGYNWLYELWLHGQNDRLPAYASWRFPSWENSIVYPGGRQDDEVLLIEQTSTPEWFAQEIGADFSSFVGKIYGEFDETVHIKTHEYNPRWATYGAWDWGFVNPLAFIELQVDPQDNVYIFREHVKAYWNLQQHIEYLRARANPSGYHMDCSFGDAADPEAASTISQGWIPCMTDPMAKANWRQGIDLVKKFLRRYETGFLDEFEAPLMAPKLFIDPSCVNVIKEFPAYKAPDKTPSNLKESSTNSAAQKEDDHCLDAIRYCLMHVFELGAKHHLAEVAGAGALGNAASGGHSPETSTYGFNEPVNDDQEFALASSSRGFFTSGKDF